MGKIIDITDKLSFDDNPKLRIKNKEIEVNTDAPSMLKIMGLLGSSEGAPGVNEMLKAYEIIFPENSRKILDALKLSLNDLMTVIQEAVSLVLNTGDALGEQ